MLFSEIYSIYYSTLSEILAESLKGPVSEKRMRRIIHKRAFEESGIYMESALKENRWQLVTRRGRTVLENTASTPMTLLEKRWMKAVTLDPRYRLFTDDIPEYPGIEPLFRPEDIYVFDRYLDGDEYTSEKYRKVFRTVLEAVRGHYPLSINMTGRRGRPTYLVVMPESLEYSRKDDKFRLLTSGSRRGAVVNLGRIESCKPYRKEFHDNSPAVKVRRDKTVSFLVKDERNALERVLLHFAHLEKRAERLDDDTYRVDVTYDREDEAEMVIRILSFGPLVKVTHPASFVEMIRKKLKDQKACEAP